MTNLGLLASLVLALPLVLPALAAGKQIHSFKRIQLTPEFWAEGANFADFNRDGHQDVVYGPFWFEGPAFTKRHEYRHATASFTTRAADGSEKTISGYEGVLGTKNAYSDCFFLWSGDFNSDGWPDILLVGIPGEQGWWFENPRGKAGPWPKHLVLDVVDNESPEYRDLDGDGRPELVCNHKGFFGYAKPNPADPAAPWKFTAISPDNKYHRFTHGLGVGDVNGDGRLDLLESNGWWEQPASQEGAPLWKHHPFAFCPPTNPGVPVGGAQLFAYDVNGDGRNDVITAIACHGYGLAWYEQVRTGQDISFKQHLFVNQRPEENRHGVAFSQPHALALVDMDGDGLKDLVTGKRFWAHGPDGDPDPNGTPVLYWFKLARERNGAVDWLPHVVDRDSGVGTQVVVGDLNGDQRPDIVVGNKRGAYVFLQEVRTVGQTRTKARQLPGAAADLAVE